MGIRRAGNRHHLAPVADETLLARGAGHRFGLPGYEGIVRARPFESWAASHLRDAALSILKLRAGLPKESENECELPVSEAFLFALLLCSVLAVVLVWGLDWFLCSDWTNQRPRDGARP
jgi:hypothetical protein